MTWPVGIAAVLGLASAFLITHDQHQQRSTTHTKHTRRTENRHGRQDQQNHREEDHPAAEDDPAEDRR